MNNIKNKSVIFCRVSSKEQEESGYSLPSQKKYLLQYTQKQGFETKKIFSISESASGKKQREAFRSMVEYATSNNIKIIICEKADRLTRNFKDMVLIDEWLEKDEERQIHLVKDSLVLHKNSRSQEKLNWGIRILFAKNYIDNLSEEVKKGQKEKIEQGWFPKSPPPGYFSIGEKGKITHVIDIKAAPFIKRMFELYSTGNYSLNSLVEVMHKDGLRSVAGRKIGTSMMHRLLTEPFYYGSFVWNKKLYPGKHEPIITEELFELVQQRISRKLKQPVYKKHFFIFKGMCRCASCGCTITWEKKKGHIYGHCNHYKDCSQKGCVRQEDIERQVLNQFINIAPRDEKILAILNQALKEHHAEESETTNAKREKLNNIIAQMDRRLEAIYIDKIDGVLVPELYQKKFEQFHEIKEQAIKDLDKLSKDKKQYYEAGFAIHELASKAVRIYNSEKATIEDRRLLLSYLFSNHTLNNRTLASNYTKAAEFLLQWMPVINQTFEPTNLRLDKIKTDAFAPAFLISHGM